MIQEMDTNELAELLKQKPEIDFRVDFYRNVLKNTDNAVKAIEKTLRYGFERERFFILFIFPVSRRKVLNSYERAKLEIEKQDLRSSLFSKTEMFERWLQRSKQYDERFELISNECNMFYDWMLQQAKYCAKTNVRLAQQMEQYMKKGHEGDQRLKNEFYLYIKKEVENRYSAMKKKLVLGTKGLDDQE